MRGGGGGGGGGGGRLFIIVNLLFFSEDFKSVKIPLCNFVDTCPLWNSHVVSSHHVFPRFNLQGVHVCTLFKYTTVALSEPHMTLVTQLT